MSSNRSRWFFPAVVLAALLGVPTAVTAQDLGELNRQYLAQRKAEQWREAERLGLRILEVAQQRRESEWVATALWNLGTGYEAEKKYADAETYFQRALAAYEQLRGAEHQDVVECLVRLADLLESQGRFARAQPYLERVVKIKEKLYGSQSVAVANSLNNLAILYKAQGQYAKAEPLYQRSLTIREAQLGKDHPDVAASLNNLATLYHDQGQYAKAEPLYLRSLTIREAQLGKDHPDVADSLNNLANLYKAQGQYAKAEPLYLRSLTIREAQLGKDHPDVADSLNNLAILYKAQGQYAKAEPLYLRSLTIREAQLGKDHPDVAHSLNNLAILYMDQGQYAKAEPLHLRSLHIKEAQLGKDHPDVAHSLNNLAILYKDQGQYAKAEPLYLRSLTIREAQLGKDHPDVAQSLNNLANLYENQGHYAKAEPLYLRSLTIREAQLGKDHPAVAQSLNNLANLYKAQGQYAKAEPLYQRSLTIREAQLGKDHPDVAASLNNLATLYMAQGQYARAEPLYLRSLTIREAQLGKDHPDVATSLNNLAGLYHDQDRITEAERLNDRAMAIVERSGIATNTRFLVVSLRARLNWKADRRQQAVADLRQAMDLAEQIQAQGTGAEQDRARFFADFTGPFERMVDWQLQLGDVGEALAAMERSRARALREQMELAGVDLLAGLPDEQSRPLRQREAEARIRVTTLEQRLRLLDGRRDLSSDDRNRQRDALLAELTQARQEQVEAYGSIRTASPVYRLTIGKERKPAALPALQAWVARDNGLLLEYLLGEDGGYVLVIPADGNPRVEKLTVSKEQAQALGIEAGPLTARRLEAALANEAGSGVLQRLSRADRAEQAIAPLAVLWEVLIPEAERAALAAGKVKRLAVVPDGSLALLPFEVLVLRKGQTPRYLLDVDTPIVYGPSATVLLNLAGQPAAGAGSVLTVGDPAYATVAAAGIQEQLTARSRYGAVGGRLSRLPNSGVESEWVAGNYRKNGQKVVELRGAQATESNLRSQIAGRGVVHLACHGLADQAHGNFFGCLALAPGRSAADPADDGFLTLGEIYALNLRGCELAILSACETNYGPRQRGEGVWALSRGFLVAGARRVVASNWLVDDEAAASLVSLFTETLAKADAGGQRPDHAATLHAAKRWARQQERWQSPYYWASFVLVGPN